MLVDTHCHLFFDELKKDLDGVLSRAAALGVTKFICVGTNVEDSQHSYELSLKYENIFSTAGVHPHDSEEVPKDYLDKIKVLLVILFKYSLDVMIKNFSILIVLN